MKGESGTIRPVRHIVRVTTWDIQEDHYSSKKREGEGHNMKKQNSRKKDQLQHILEQREIVKAEQDWSTYVMQQRLKSREHTDHSQKQREQELAMRVMMKKAKDREEAPTNNSKALEKEIKGKKIH